jgi:hypothetical protein
MQVEAADQDTVQIEFTDSAHDALTEMVTAVVAISSLKEGQRGVSALAEPGWFELGLSIEEFLFISFRIGFRLLNEQSETLFEHKAQRDEILLAFWRGLRKFQSEWQERFPEFWRFGFPSLELDALSTRVSSIRF